MDFNIHPLASLFPLMQGEEFRRLCEDIRKRGLLNPIVRHDGAILDGRNRALACEETGRTMHFVEFSDLRLSCSPEQYIWSANIERRHLTDDQMAGIAMQWRPQFMAEGMKAKEEGGKKAGKCRSSQVLVNSPKPIQSSAINELPEQIAQVKPSKPVRTRRRLAEMAGVAEARIQSAEMVASIAPELLPRVVSGELSLRDAVLQVKAIPRTTKRQTILRVATKNKLVDCLSHVNGICEGLKNIDPATMLESLTVNESSDWASVCRRCSKTLAWLSNLLNGKYDETQQNTHGED